MHQDGNYESGPPKALQSGDTQQPAKFSQGNHRSAALAEKDLNKKVQKRSASEAFDIDDNDRPSKRLQPVGLYNHYYACFANAVLQCLHGAGPLSSHYGPKASGVLQGVANCGVTEKDFKQFTAGRRATREDTRKKDTVRGALHRATQAM